MITFTNRKFKCMSVRLLTQRKLANNRRRAKISAVTANFCRLSLAVCTEERKYLYLRCIVGEIFLFLCDLFKDYKKTIKETEVIFSVCRKCHAQTTVYIV